MYVCIHACTGTPQVLLEALGGAGAEQGGFVCRFVHLADGLPVQVYIDRYLSLS